MSLISINTNPSGKQLAVFGATWLVVFGAAGVMLLRRGAPLPAVLAVWIAAAAVPVVGAVLPRLLRGVYVGMSYAAMPIGVVVSFLLLAAVYYLLLTPIGLVMRLLGHDPMSRKFPSGLDSHWLPRDTRGQDVRRYFRQF
jgi:hypothetical protein